MNRWLESPIQPTLRKSPNVQDQVVPPRHPYAHHRCTRLGARCASGTNAMVATYPAFGYSMTATKALSQAVIQPMDATPLMSDTSVLTAMQSVSSLLAISCELAPH